MATQPNPQKPQRRQESEHNTLLEMARARRPSLVREYFAYVKQNKKWWILPIILCLLLLAGLIILSGSSVAPLIYTLF